jgi:hypothetical protein
MRSRELLLFTFWTSIPLVMIFSLIISAGCTPLEVKESEIIAEEVIKEDLEHRQ